MKNIIKIEFLKINKYPFFWITAGITIGLFVLFTSTSALFDIKFIIGQELDGIDLKSYFRFPHIWNTFTWIASWFNLFLTFKL